MGFLHSFTIESIGTVLSVGNEGERGLVPNEDGSDTSAKILTLVEERKVSIVEGCVNRLAKVFY